MISILTARMAEPNFAVWPSELMRDLRRFGFSPTGSFGGGRKRPHAG
jgi:hypothetical protein